MPNKLEQAQEALAKVEAHMETLTPRTFLTSYPARFIRLRNSSRSAGRSASAVSMARRSLS